MLPTGFLGTRADVLMDIIVIAIIVIPFLILYSFHMVRKKQFRSHRNLMVTLLSILSVAVILFEADIRLSGGTKAFIENSSYTETTFFKVYFVFHITIAILTILSWLFLTILSWNKYTDSLPGSFTPAHKKWGHMTFGGVILTAITGIGLYVIGFVL